MKSLLKGIIKVYFQLRPVMSFNHIDINEIIFKQNGME